MKPVRAFLDLYQQDGPKAKLWPQVGVPGELFLAPDTQEPYCEGRLVPILDDGNFDTVVFLNPGRGHLVVKDIEDPHRIVAEFKHWGQYLAYLFFQMAETVDDDDALLHLAELIGFTRVEEAMAILDAGSHSGRDYKEHQTEFIAGLG